MALGCEWIEGDPRSGLKCGEPVCKPGGAWCLSHHARVYIGQGRKLRAPIEGLVRWESPLSNRIRRDILRFGSVSME